jgi:tetratricopeptide (TPR) repeat protein
LRFAASKSKITLRATIFFCALLSWAVSRVHASMTSRKKTNGKKTNADNPALTCLLALALVCPGSQLRAQSSDSAPSTSQTPQSSPHASVQGTVRDSSGHALPGVKVSLQRNDGSEPVVVRTDASGNFRFAELRDGVYTLQAEKERFTKFISDPWDLKPEGIKNKDIILAPLRSAGEKSSSSAASPPKTNSKPEFFDEPAFTVAGVTDTTNIGGHGSTTVVRSQEALAKETVSLSQETSAAKTPASSASILAKEKSLREILQREPDNPGVNHNLGNALLAEGKPEEAISYLERASRLNSAGDNTYLLARAYAGAGNYEKAQAAAQTALNAPDRSGPEQAQIHHLLADVEENQGNSLEAVREYQRAAELDPNESNLFDWGAELLAHRALEPAVEVFTQGNRRFPTSARILIGLGVALYAHGLNDQAAQRLCEASDLNPQDKTPYLFLGKMQSAEITQPDCLAGRFERFAQLQPQDALANYYEAISLAKQRKTSNHQQTLPQEQALLEKAVQLDPRLGIAYLQLGTVYYDQHDLPRAISAYQSAVAVSPELEEAHYRLGQAYRRNGDAEKAQQELELYAQLSKKAEEQLERQRHDIQQFVYTLRTPAATRSPE